MPGDVLKIAPEWTNPKLDCNFGSGSFLSPNKCLNCPRSNMPSSLPAVQLSRQDGYGERTLLPGQGPSSGEHGEERGPMGAGLVRDMRVASSQLQDKHVYSASQAPQVKSVAEIPRAPAKQTMAKAPSRGLRDVLEEGLLPPLLGCTSDQKASKPNAFRRSITTFSRFSYLGAQNSHY